MTHVIRPAAAENADQTFELMYSTMGKFADAALGIGSHDLCMQAVRGFFQKRGNRFSFDRTHLVWIEGKMAGLLLSFPGWEFNRRTWIIALQAWSIYGVRKTIQMFLTSMQVFSTKETERNEYYIAHLAVHPDFRRLGVGATLLDHAAMLARRANLEKLSLIVELGNDPAISLYQKSGFSLVETRETPELVERFHTPGYHRMVKII